MNAGHNPTYIIRGKNSLEELKTGGIPLGMMGLPFPYTSKSTVINPGDRLVLYTDGVTEAMNENEEEYGEERLEQLIIENKNQTTEKIAELIIESVNHYAGALPQSDDITLVVIKRN